MTGNVSPERCLSQQRISLQKCNTATIPHRARTLTMLAMCGSPATTWTSEPVCYPSASRVFLPCDVAQLAAAAKGLASC